MSDQQNESPQGAEHTDQAEQPKPTETVDFWKQKAREWEKRAKSNTDAADRLAEIEESQKSEAEKHAERVAIAERRAIEAEARVLRREVALEHKLTTEDAALLDTVTDEDTMRKLAERLAAGSDNKQRNTVPREGSNPPAKPDERRAFADFLTGNAR